MPRDEESENAWWNEGSDRRSDTCESGTYLRAGISLAVNKVVASHHIVRPRALCDLMHYVLGALALNQPVEGQEELFVLEADDFLSQPRREEHPVLSHHTLSGKVVRAKLAHAPLHIFWNLLVHQEGWEWGGDARGREGR